MPSFKQLTILLKKMKEKMFDYIPPKKEKEPCHSPYMSKWNEINKCRHAELENGVWICYLGRKQKGFHCDWEKPS